MRWKESIRKNEMPVERIAMNPLDPLETAKEETAEEEAEEETAREQTAESI